MTALEAIASAAYDIDKWVRPITWAGTGDWLCCRNGYLMRVPGPRGAYDWNPRAADLLCEWEVCSGPMGDEP